LFIALNFKLGNVLFVAYHSERQRPQEAAKLWNDWDLCHFLTGNV